MAIVRYLIEMPGGQVIVISTGLNRGTTFTVTLPIYDVSELPSEAVEETPPAANEDVENPAGVSILLVEDNDDAWEMLKVLFAQ